MIPPEAYERDRKPGNLDNYKQSPAIEQARHESREHKLYAANWLKPLLDPATRKQIMAYSALRIRDKFSQHPVQAIAFTGLSGSIIAGPLATELECYLYAVRKIGESKHSSLGVEGLASDNALPYLIVDDFVNTGETIRRIALKVWEHTGGTAKCIGVYCWRDDEFYTGDDLAKLLENEKQMKEGVGSLI
jgi:adenine/guanine phosphoribosyltransferase-like PRPP-binding protein